jgi:hypothetical protein
MNGRKAGGFVLIALSAMLFWSALSDGSFTFANPKDASFQETVTIVRNPVFYTGMLAVFSVIGVAGLRLLLAKERAEGPSFLDANQRFRCGFGSYARVAFLSLATSRFGILFFITAMIFVYLADFVTNQTRFVMASILFVTLCAKLLSIAMGTPKEIRSDEEGLSIERWMRKPTRIPFSALEKSSVDQNRVSIWYGHSEQIVFPSVLLPDLALESLRQTIEKGANQALQTTSVTRSGFGKVPASDRQRRGV